jgi:nicotinic acid mononucleotide adenylyltransferase
MEQIPVELEEQYRSLQAVLQRLDPGEPPTAIAVPPTPEPRGQIIVFPASFNPPTTAHLALLRKAQEQGGPGVSVYAALSKQIIDKEHVERPTLLDRLVLLQQLLQHELASVGLLLFNRGLYVEQARAVRRSFPAVSHLTFLVGFDKIVQIFDPRYYSDRDAALRELFGLAHLLVAPRGRDGEKELRALLERPENRPFANAVQTLPFDPAYREISSTRVRQNPTAYAGDVPPEVLRFIQAIHAYEAPTAQGDPYEEHLRAVAALLKKEAPDEKQCGDCRSG